MFQKFWHHSQVPFTYSNQTLGTYGFMKYLAKRKTDMLLKYARLIALISSELTHFQTLLKRTNLGLYQDDSTERLNQS